jgi:two-component system, cell cycle response regulator DivK
VGEKLNIKNYNWEGKHVLIVEDDYPSFVYLNTLIGYARATTHHIQDGLKAIDFCRDNHVDLVLMDIQLPGISGFDATREIKKLKPQLPIVAQTAFALKGEKEKSLDAGCDAYITKPIDKNFLIELLDRYLSGNK